MSINTTTQGWNKSTDFSELFLATKKIKLSQTIDTGDMLGIQANAAASGLETLELIGCVFVASPGQTPEISDLPAIAAAATLQTIDLTGGEGISGNIPSGWSVCTVLENLSINDCGYNAAALDAFLISLNVAVQAGLGSEGTPGVINVAGDSNGIRTSASDAAVTALGGAGFTVTENS